MNVHKTFRRNRHHGAIRKEIKLATKMASLVLEHYFSMKMA